MHDFEGNQQQHCTIWRLLTTLETCMFHQKNIGNMHVQILKKNQKKTIHRACTSQDGNVM